jgi:hypothetical protein
MPAPRATLLRETANAAPSGAKVIDAKFQVVAKRGLMARVRAALITTLWFALAGLLVPPIWMIVERLNEAPAG